MCYTYLSATMLVGYIALLCVKCKLTNMPDTVGNRSTCERQLLHAAFTIL